MQVHDAQFVGVFTRHLRTCQYRGKREYRHWRKCGCPKWLYYRQSGDRIRESAQTIFWSTAEEKARKKEQELRNAALGKPLPAEAGLTIADAITRYLANKRSERLSDVTIKKLELIFKRRLLDWCNRNGIHYLAHLTLPKLQEWRGTWPESALAASKTQQRVRGFFLFLHNNGWITTNPARGLSKIRLSRKEPSYFTNSELEKILDATYIYGKTETERRRVRAFVQLMRWSGLAVRDAVTLERSKLDHQDRLILQRTKTSEPVFVELPYDVAEELRNVPNGLKPNPRYFFWSGSGLPKTAVADWQRALRRLFELADIKHPDNTKKRCHSHMFRHTFSIHLLDAGVPIETVAALLGHSSTKTTEKYYKSHTQVTQQRISLELRKAWKVIEKRKD
jgi:site-specific recombinase XerD